jgi:hypothetical protein
MGRFFFLVEPEVAHSSSLLLSFTEVLHFKYDRSLNRQEIGSGLKKRKRRFMGERILGQSINEIAHIKPNFIAANHPGVHPRRQHQHRRRESR